MTKLLVMAWAATSLLAFACSDNSASAGGNGGCSDDSGGGSCCKTCTSSKPCGDSCIPTNQTCHTTGGCACGEANGEVDGGQ